MATATVMNNFVIIPTYNEVNNIAVVFEKILSLYPDINILVVDDNSPDGTAAVVRRYAVRHSNIKLLSRPKKLGLASAYIGAIKKVIREHQNIGALITFDADLAHDPAVIGQMLGCMNQYDLVIGSRYVAGGRIPYWNWWRRMLSRSGNFYARVITKTPLRDMTSGFHCFKADLLRAYDLDRIVSTGFAFLMEMKIIAHRLDANVLEIPITLGDRKDGKSKLSNRIIYEGLVLPWRLRNPQKYSPRVGVDSATEFQEG